MKVEIIDTKDKAWDVLDCGTATAEMKDFTNPVNGKEDPRLFFKPNRWIHVSTLYRQKLGSRIKNIETGEIITISNLSPC